MRLSLEAATALVVLVLASSCASMANATGGVVVDRADELVNEMEQQNNKKKLNVAVIALPFMGHFLPVKSIGEKLARRGHNVTFLIENTDWCVSPVEGMQCVRLPTTGKFPDAMYHQWSLEDDTGGTMMEILDVMQAYHDASLPQFLTAFEEHIMVPGFQADVIVSDFSCYAILGVAAKYDLPLVTVFPLLLRTSLEPLSWLPLLGSEDSMAAMSFGKRWKTYFISLLVNLIAEQFKTGQINAVRAQYGIRPLRGLYEWSGMGGLIFSPTLWSFPAAPHPQWPNHYPVGLLHPELEAVPLEDDLAQFLESKHCRQHGSVYVNFGTLAKQTDRAVEEIWTALTQELSMCVVWKVMESQAGGRLEAMRKRFHGTPAEQRIYLSKRFASPMAIMSHPSTFVFFTHCGDTSLGESISSALPVVGIPFFADQGDVCQRIQESGLGIHVGHKLRFTADDVVAAITLVSQNRSTSGMTKSTTPAEYKAAEGEKNSYLQAVLRARQVANFLGGPDKAAEIIESYYEAEVLPHSNEESVLTCGVVFEESKNSLFGFTDLAFFMAGGILLWKTLTGLGWLLGYLLRKRRSV